MRHHRYAALFQKILDRGGRPYVVGGYVRDLLLGRQPKDVDILVVDAIDGVEYVTMNIHASTETMNAENNQPGIRRFHFVRSEDVSGVSGTGLIGEGCELSNGKVCFTWISNKGTVSVYDNMKVFLSIHGHEGRGTVEWLDPDPTEQVEPTPKKRTTKK